MIIKIIGSEYLRTLNEVKNNIRIRVLKSLTLFKILTFENNKFEGNIKSFFLVFLFLEN